MYRSLLSLWMKTSERYPLSLSERITLAFLVFFSHIYRFGFKSAMRFRRRAYAQIPSDVAEKIISVGNLVVGGTGKTPFIQFLATILGADRVFLVSSGYRGALRDADAPLCVTPENVESVSDAAGDETAMLVRDGGITAFVHPRKERALAAVANHQRFSQTPYILLDDGYQVPIAHKRLEILLVDARAPFGNGYELPAGPLRERDLTRADVIIATHSDFVAGHEKDKFLLTVSRERSITYATSRVFWSKHAFVGIYSPVKAAYVPHIEAMGTKWHLFAGLGSFSALREMLLDENISALSYCEFPNHHAYSRDDIQEMIIQMHASSSTGLLTTYKDWVKIEPLLPEVGVTADLFCIVDMVFSFEHDADHARFLDLLRIL